MPMLQSEVVEKRHWISKEDLVDYYALSQCIPGIIATNTAIFVGYKLKGKYGAITAAFAMCLPPFAAIVCLAAFLSKLTHISLVNSVFWGVGISIILLILMTVQEIWEKSIVDKFTFLLFVSIFVLAVIFHVSPGILIIIGAFSGLVYKIIRRRFE